MRKLILAMSAQLIVAACAHAGQSRVATMYGLGNESCGNFLAALQKAPPDTGIDYEDKSYVSESRAYSEWLLAYITAFNQLNDQHKNIVHADRDGVILWVKNYCEKQPMDSVSQAAWKLIQQQGNFDVRKYK